MSAVEAVLELVRSAEFIRMLADAPSTTPKKVYTLIGEKGEAAIISYIPALAVAKKACELVGEKCIGEYKRMRLRVITEICEATGIDYIIKKILKILKQIPKWIRSLLKDVADVWSILEQWSRGEFKFGQFVKMFGLIVNKYGPMLVSAAKKAGKAMVAAGKAVYHAALWLASGTEDVAKALFMEGGTAFAEMASTPASLLADAAEAVGLKGVAEAIRTVVNAVEEGAKAAGSVIVTVLAPWTLL